LFCAAVAWSGWNERPLSAISKRSSLSSPFAVGYYETKSEGLGQSFPPEFLPKPESDKV
jgi:hypothetical protein